MNVARSAVLGWGNDTKHSGSALQRLKRSILPLLCLAFLTACHDSGLLVQANSTPPTANAGTAQHVTLPATVTLDGSASSSADSGALTYSWAWVTIPTGSAAALASPRTVSPTFTPDVPGDYVAQLIVSEGSLASTPTTVTIGVSGTVELLANGSFESGLSGWTVAQNLEAGASGRSSFNGVVAPGSETLTGAGGWTATDGTQTALGYVEDTANNGLIITAALYQDVAIPAHATALTISLDIGLKNLVHGTTNAMARAGLYPTSSVPDFNAVSSSLTSLITYGKVTADANLVAKTATASAASLAGNTYRFAILNAANGSGGVGSSGSEVIGVDHVHLTAFLTY